MLFSLNELKRIANLSDDIQVLDVVNAINSIGFEVEEYNKFSNVEGIKFGRILKITKNPNADKLNVCEIEFSDKKRTIQTNATNVFVGQIIIAFVPGSKIGDTIFNEKEIKGIVSEGMLSNPSEFGIDIELVRPSSIDGIASYPEIEDLSLDPIEYLSLDDYVIDVDILTNRSDANSYFVMAMELSAYFNTKPNIPNLRKPNIETNIVAKNGEANSLVFMQANVEKVSIKEQILLSKHGIKSINDATDLSNLVLIYTGQPTHVYDVQKGLNNFIAEKRTSNVNVLGNKVVELKDDLVVVANDKIVSIASVIGIEEQATTEKTKEALFEFGIFKTSSVRKAIKSVKLNTNSSSQGSKILSIGTTIFAISYLSNRLKSFSLPINLTIRELKKISYDKEMINRYAGFDIVNEPKFQIVVESLTKLGFVFEGDEITVPLYRHDINQMEDMIEEIFRFYGYENFKTKKPLVNSLKVFNNHVVNLKKKISASGYQEIKTYSLISKEKNIFNPFNFDKNINLETFVSREREVIRNSQTYSILEIAEHNIKRGIKDLSLFSYGMINDSLNTFAGISTFKNFNDIKKDIVNILGNIDFKRMEDTYYHPGVSAYLVKDKEIIGYIGKVHPSLSSVDAFLWEFIDKKQNKKIAYVKYDDSPLKFEDINIETNDDVGTKINKIKPKDTFSTKVIDEYINDKGNRKVTVRFVKK